MSVTDGSSVNFSASSAFSFLTKTEYSGGYVKDGDYERINWLSGDRITIISPDCVVYDKSVTPWQPRLTHASPYYSEADYVIASNGTPDGRYSTSSIMDADAGEKGLHWWPDQEISGQARPNHYVFFGVYPSPYALVDSVKAVTDFTTNTESTKGIITAYLPKVQKYSKVSTPVSSVRNSSVDSTHVYPQMEYAWMWSAQYAPKAEENVKMFFSPMVTTFQIAVTGLDATEVPISKFQLVSENHALQGTFVATTTVGRDAVDRDHLDRMSVEYSGIPSRIAGNNDEVTFLLPEGTVVSSTKKVTFTVFVYPEGSSSSAVLDGLSLRFVSPGITRSLKLKYSASASQNAGSWVQFPAGRKINIDGITLPRQEDPWTFTVTGEDWEEELSDIVVTPVQITEHENQEGGSLDDRAYVLDVDWESLTLDEGGGARPDFALVKSYKDNADKTPVAYQLEYYDGTQWKAWDSNAPAWLSIPSPASGWAGSYAGDALALTMSPQLNSAADAHRSAMIAKGSYSTAFDLSTRNVATGETVSMTTANSYVADRPGKYKLPLVYGNGVKDGSPNPDAYSQSLTTAEGFLTTFLDHKDNPITSPYIATQHSGKTLTPVIIWTDAPGLVKDLSVSGSGTNAYLNFTVPAENITQGNALVGVTIDGEIAWSWHIWVTEEDLTVLSEVGSGNRMPRVNLGWCETISKTYAARSCSLRVVQPVSGQIAGPVVAGQSAANYTIRENNPYYQWGRKDPIQAANGGANKTYYPSTAAYAPQHGVVQRVSIGMAIRTPYIFYSYDAPDPADRDWCSTVYVNRWDSHWTGTVTEPTVTKTVYDPSPVGFQMPMRNFYYGTGASCALSSGGFTVNGLVFPISGYRLEGTIYSNYGSYWTAEQDPTRPATYSWMLYFNSSQWYASTAGASTMASAVRPVVVSKPVYSIGQLQGASLTHTGGSGQLSRTTTFQSIVRLQDGSTRPIPFELQYSEDGSGWTSTPPDWLSAYSESSWSGSVDGETLTFFLAPQVNSGDDGHHDIMAARTPKVNFDLSTINVATGAQVARTTANCYVVQAPGTYRLPLVYGNGVKNGSVNETAYRGRLGVNAAFLPDDGDGYYLGSFKDHLDHNIYSGGDAHSSPYLTKHLGREASEFKAILTWQDLPGLVEVDATISGTGENAYLTFRVPDEYIAQGNAQVAVLVDDDNDGIHETIAWSWHIWVTDQDMTATKAGSSPFMFAPVNIGWCDGPKTEVFEARSIRVRAFQRESGLTSSVVTVSQQAATSVKISSNTYYFMWGMKNPLKAKNHAGSGTYYDKVYYPSLPEFNPNTPNAPKYPFSIGASIQNYHLYLGNKGAGTLDDWCEMHYVNLWNSSYSGVDLPDPGAYTKTIYDPSPVGFCVPPYSAWADFDVSNYAHGAVNDMQGGVYTPSGLFFPTTGLRWFGGGGTDHYWSYVCYWSSSPTLKSYTNYHQPELNAMCFSGDLVEYQSAVQTPKMLPRYRSFGVPVRPVVGE